MIASAINVVKWASLGVIIFGEKIQLWNKLNVQPPQLYNWAQENKVVSCLSVFFLSNTVENGLLQTGAFEIELNGVTIWSKLKSGRIPQGEEIFEIIDNHLRLSGASGRHQINDFGKNKQPQTFTMPSEDFRPSNVDEDEFGGDHAKREPIVDEFDEFNFEEVDDKKTEL